MEDRFAASGIPAPHHTGTYVTEVAGERGELLTVGQAEEQSQQVATLLRVGGVVGERGAEVEHGVVVDEQHRARAEVAQQAELRLLATAPTARTASSWARR
ncbi:MAG: hypothetical protein R2755_30855 [Acidimicrobiales bacterium]